jgi:hypothetical protein
MKIQIEIRAGGHAAEFTLYDSQAGDPRRYTVSLCCAEATVDLIDEDARQCLTSCPRHGDIQRQYSPAMTDEQRAEMNLRLSGLSSFNPASDPHGERQQRRRKSGSTTHRWYEARS